MLQKKRLLVIGPILPPVGGISIHIDRLANIFHEEFIIDYVDEARQRKKGIYNLRSLNLITYFRKISRADIIFVHSVTRVQRYFHLMAGKLTKAKIIFSVHTYPKALGFPLGVMDRFIFNFADRIIFVNQQMKSFLPISDEKVFVKHAFLPPVLENESELGKNLTDKIDFAKSEGRTIISSNGWKLQKFNGEDMYGLDLCIQATQSLKLKGIFIYFIFNVSTTEGVEDYYKSQLELIRRLSLEDSFLLINEKLSFVKLIQVSDITVRATNTDGDSLSIRESLFFEKPIIASDVVERPDGVVLFKTRDVNDLTHKLELEISNASNSKGNAAENLIEIKRFYDVVFAV